MENNFDRTKLFDNEISNFFIEPKTPPNLQPPDLGQVFKDGCHAYSDKHTHWWRDWILGGVEVDDGGRVVRWVREREREREKVECVYNNDDAYYA